jgi:carbonic anhydrase
VVQDAWARGQTLSVHGWVYGLRDGLLKDLQVTMDRPDMVVQVFSNAIKRYPRQTPLQANASADLEDDEALD